FLEIAELEPLFGGSFLTTYAAMGAELLEAGTIIGRARPRGARGKAILHDYWNLLHATGHLALLGSMARDRDAYAQLSESVAGSRAALSFPLVGTGVVAFILKGAWAAGRLGKLVMPAYKRALAEDVALYDLFDTLIALLAIGTRTRGLRAEIRKAVLAAPSRAETTEARRLREGAEKEIRLTCQLTADLLDADPDLLEQDLFALGQRVFDPSAAPPEDDPLARDLARTLPLMARTDGLSDGRKLVSTLHLVAATAAGPPEQFYLPRALLTKLRDPWRPAHTLQILEPRAAVERHQRRPVVRAQSVGRNDPCPCGSGEKWKRCCGG
ncbi:MAG: SEC-C domain-containing protein, partial [Myxococcales bacterium]|nr:SEC-C domain-containing protein [Myxococcales bacterium]